MTDVFDLIWSPFDLWNRPPDVRKARKGTIVTHSKHSATSVHVYEI
jgi:hypothetical protein